MNGPDLSPTIPAQVSSALRKRLGLSGRSLETLGAAACERAYGNLIALEEKVRRLERDKVMGLLVREPGDERMAVELARCQRTKVSAVLVFIDVDGLKQANDNLGYAQGDALLQTVGDRVRRGIRAYDLAVRWGGDEIVVLMPGTSEAQVAKRFRAISRELEASPAQAKISIGVVLADNDETLSQLIQRASERMQSDRRGRRSGAA